MKVLILFSCLVIAVTAKSANLQPHNVWNTTCPECEHYVSLAHAFFGDSSLKTKLTEVLEDSCIALFPKSLRPMCAKMVDSNVDIILQTLQAFTAQPEALCEHLLMCPPPSSDVKPNPPKANSLCLTCRSAIDAVVAAFNDPTLKQAYDVAAQFMCSMTSFAQQCTTAFENGFKTAIATLNKYLGNAENVCKSIHLCGNDLPNQPKGVACTYCKKYTGQFDAVLRNHTLVNGIIDSLRKVCGVFPGNFGDLCKAYVTEFVPGIIGNILGVTGDTEKFCTDLGVCFPNKNGLDRAKKMLSKKIVWF